MEPVKKREIFGWAMFDFANSSYTTVVITAVYSAFFTEVVVPAGSTARDSYWSLAMVLSTSIALVLSPLAGAISDKRGQKKPYLLGSTIVCALATAGLGLVGAGDVALGIGIVVVGNAAFMLSETFCGSFLPELSTPENMGKISGLGWGLGYFGGLSSLALVALILGDRPMSEATEPIHHAMFATGAFFMVAALPTLILVRDRGRPQPGFEAASLGRLTKAGFRELGGALRTARANPVLFRFFLAFMVYMAGLEAVIKFVGIYARAELSFGTGDIALMFLVLQISAAGGALGFGVVESKLGPKRTVLLTLGLWVVAIMAIFWLRPIAELIGQSAKATFIGISLLAGTNIGATQSSSRTVVGLLAPAERSAEMFGFWGTFARLGTILGMSFGVASDALSSRQLALLLVAGFFAIGGIMLSRIPIDEAARARGHG